jgi:hypothetical protein
MAEASWEAAVHEAGHVVVGIATRRGFTAVSVTGETGLSEFAPWEWTAPLLGGSVARVRRGLVLDVAGHVAEDLHREWVGDGQLYRHGRNAILLTPHRGVTPFPCRTSDRMRRDDSGYGPGTDLHDVVVKAVAICQFHAFRSLAAGAPANDTDETKSILAEVGRAERRAAKILQRNWNAVLKLSAALVSRQTHRLTAKDVFRLIGEPK